MNLSTGVARYYPCGCAKHLDTRGHHWLCCEEAQHTPGTGRVCDVVLASCLHDEPERCEYMHRR